LQEKIIEIEINLYESYPERTRSTKKKSND